MNSLKSVLKNYCKVGIPNITSEDLLTIDSWRGILSIIVFLGHLIQIFWIPLLGHNNMVIRISGDVSFMSVIAFFCLSGFVIFRSLLNNFFKNNGNLDYVSYLISRFSRVYPPFFASIILVFIIRFLVFHFDLLGGNRSFRLPNDLAFSRTHFDFSLEEAWLTLKMSGAYLGNVNGPIWTLVIEWWLYLVGLFVFFLFSSHKIGVKLFVFLLLIICLKQIHSLNAYVYLFMWLISGLLFIFYNYKKKYQNVTFVLGSIGFISVLIYKYQNELPINISDQLSLQVFFALIFIGGFLRFTIKKKIFHFFSSFAYSLYIFHFPLLLFIFSLTHEYVEQSKLLLLIVSFVSFGLCFLFSYFISKIVENKIIFLNFLNHKF
jgi:peptidoglycan/LPS O-acetylase OafA/YrhL